MVVATVTFCGVIACEILGGIAVVVVIVVVAVVVGKFVERSGNFFGSKGLVPFDPAASVLLVS